MSNIYNEVEKPCADALPDPISTDFENNAISKEISSHLSAKVLFATKVANIGIWEYLFEQKKLIADNILLSHFGITAPGFIGHYETLWGYVHPEDKISLVTEVHHALNNQANIDMECRIIHKDGSLHYIKINALFLLDEKGKPCSLIGSSRDITSQKNAASELLESEAKFRSFYENIPDALLLTVIDGDILAANPAAIKMFQMSEEEICAAGRFGLADHSDPRVGPLIEERARNGWAKGEITFKRKDGTKFPGEITSVVFADASGENRSSMMIRDLTDNLDAERNKKAIEVERQSFLDLYSQAPSCMGVLKGPNHIYEMANPLYLQLIGKKDIIGKTVKEVLPELESQGVFEFLDGVYNTGETFSANEMLVKFDFHGNGQLVDTYLNFIYQAHRDIDNNIDGIFFFAIDVTEQVISRKKIEESEKQFRQIVETAQEGIWLIDENNRTTFVNKKLCEIFEYSEEEMMGKKIYDFMDDEGKELAAKLIERKKDGESGQANFKYIAKSGKEIWTNVSANPLFDDDNCYKGSLAMVTDITDRIIIQRQLFDEQIYNQKEITKAVIKAQEKERREIGEELHDNVNQLLATAKLYLSHSLSITDGYKPIIMKSQEYLTTAVEEIRKLTKALVGPANENDMGLIETIRELIIDIQLIREIQIEFTHDTYNEQETEEGLKLVIYRILQEQLTNILKHSEATQIVINIKNETDLLILHINDNGKGFDTSTSRNGIGLKNIYHRAGIYNGEVSINSSPNKGCTLSVRFQQPSQS